MYPSILDGDIVTISSPGKLPPSVGEVVAFTRPELEKLLIHRIIRKTPDGYLIKGDNNVEPDGIIPEACLLGVVNRVEHHGKRKFWPDRFRHRILARPYFFIAHVLNRWSRPARGGLLDLGSRIVHSRTYRRIMKCYHGNVLSRIELKVINPDLPMGEPRPETGRHLVKRQSPERGASTQEHLVVTAHINQRQVGLMEFFKSPANCPFSGWWIGDYEVSIRFMGSGLEEIMISEAERVLAARGITSMRINLPDNSRCIKSWCRDAGLRSVPAGKCTKTDSFKRFILEKL